MYKTLIKEIINKHIKDCCLEELMCDTFCTLKALDYDMYTNLEHKMYKLAYNGHLSKELATKWVASMKNKDGSIGEHWSYEYVSKYNDEHDMNDWYAVLNMMYSDYYNTKFVIEDYIQLANDFIDDKDVGDTKVLDYYLHVVCENKK